MNKILIYGVELNYIEFGEGYPLIFVHGSLGDLNTFSPQFNSFSQKYHVYSYSRRFHPPNEIAKNVTIYSNIIQVDDLARLIIKLNLRKVHIVGTSYGAYIALMMSLKYPLLVRSLVLAEPPILPLLKNTPQGESVLSEFENNVLEPSRNAFKNSNFEEGLRRFIDGIKNEKGAFDKIPPQGKADIMRFGEEMKLEMLTDPDHYMPLIGDSQLNKLEIPTLLLSGEMSSDLFHLITDELEKKLPLNERVIIKKAGHSMHKENYEEYNSKVLEFLLKN